jgi:transposase
VLGHQQNPPPTERTGKRGPIARSASANLLRRLDEQREHVPRFAHDFRVPFDNNLAERDLRMIKIQQKISGWRTTTGADRLLALRSYINTSRKQDRDTIDALARLAKHQPRLPTTTGPRTATSNLNSHVRREFWLRMSTPAGSILPSI